MDESCRDSRFAPECGASPMAAILLTTTTPGSEGTLGGLVAQGRRIADHLVRALKLCRLCSNDPVCASHSPERDQAERHLEVRPVTAACTSPRSAASV